MRHNITITTTLLAALALGSACDPSDAWPCGFGPCDGGGTGDADQEWGADLPAWPTLWESPCTLIATNAGLELVREWAIYSPGYLGLVPDGTAVGEVVAPLIGVLGVATWNVPYALEDAALIGANEITWRNPGGFYTPDDQGTQIVTWLVSSGPVTIQASNTVEFSTPSPFIPVADLGNGWRLALWDMGEPNSTWNLATRWMISAPNTGVLGTIAAEPETSPMAANMTMGKPTISIVSADGERAWAPYAGSCQLRVPAGLDEGGT